MVHEWRQHDTNEGRDSRGCDGGRMESDWAGAALDPPILAPCSSGKGERERSAVAMDPPPLRDGGGERARRGWIAAVLCLAYLLSSPLVVVAAAEGGSFSEGGGDGTVWHQWKRFDLVTGCHTLVFFR